MDIFFLHNAPTCSNPRGEGLTLVRLDGGDRKFKPVTQWTTSGRLMNRKTLVKSTCNGVVLLTLEHDTDCTYTLWNPTTSSTSSIVHCPYPFRFPSREAVCYDPVENDLKLVLVAWGHYIVYSSNNKSWTNNGKPAPYSLRERVDNPPPPVTVDGAVYWAENRSREIVRFDPTRNEFGSVRMPERVEGLFRLVCFGGRLCLWSWLGGTERIRVRFWMKGKGKDVNSWEEVMTIENIEMMSRARKTFEPLCLVGGDKILMRLDDGVIAVYRPSEDAFEAMLAKDMGLDDFIDSNALVPYVQSQLVLDSIMRRMDSMHI